MEKETTLDKLPPFVLNWEKTTVNLKKGRFKHFIGRPDRALLLERDKEIKSETPIAKDGGYSANAGDEEQQKTDAKYYELLKIGEPEGYSGEIPLKHQALVFTSLYRRYIFIPEDADPFADEIPVHEVFGDPDNPTHTVIHWFRQPADADVTKMDKAIKAGRYVPDKRGRQKYVTSSYLTKAVNFYEMYMVRVEDAVIEVKEENSDKVILLPYSDEEREKFLAETDILIMRRVVEVLVGELVDNLLD